MSSERWVDIPGWVGLYRVSDRGRVRSLDRPVACRFGRGFRMIKGQILKRSRTARDKTSYIFVALKDAAAHRTKACLVHRLVLEAFIGPCPEGMEACHNDGVRINNRLENLRWDTKKNNNKQKAEHGTLKRGSRHYLSKITEDDAKEIRRLYATGKFTQKELGDRFGIDHTNISIIVKHRGWKHV